jgi:hypothetical protein
MEDGSSIPYTVGNLITLPLSKYDRDGNGELSLDFNFTKKGILTNKTDAILDTNANLAFLQGSVGAYIEALTFQYGKSYAIPALYSKDFRLTSSALNFYNDSWGVNLADGSNHLLLA